MQRLEPVAAVRRALGIPTSSRRSIRPPTLVRVAAMRGTADLGSLTSGLDAPTTAPLQRELVAPTRCAQSRNLRLETLMEFPSGSFVLANA